MVVDYFGNPIEVGDEVIYLKDTIDMSFIRSKRIIVKIDGNTEVYIASNINGKSGCSRGDRLINLKYVSLPIPLGS